MFTGLIEATALIKDRKAHTLTVERPKIFDDIGVGSSISIAGVCLSVTSMTDQSMSFDVMPTTLAKTTLGDLKIGERVNLERAMPAAGRFDGHVVQGHCEGVGEIINRTQNEFVVLTIKPPSELITFIIQHGSITIDGVSLTVASKHDHSFSVALIPHTLEHTTLGLLKEGSRVNVETDVIGRYILNRNQ